MNYQESIDFLFSQLPMYQRVGKAAYKADLSTTIALAERIGNPEKKFKSIHIAGTNGKGSVAHIIASVLQQAGYKTALYTSPHYLDFRERIKINGKKIAESFVIDFVEKGKEQFHDIQPSFFEYSFAMACDYFAHEEVDIAIMETGMGGRLDSTNIITPLVTVITNIGLDHTQFLGDTMEKIAWEKAGIIKAKIPVVIGETQNETAMVFKEKALSMEAPILFADQKGKISNRQISREGLQCTHEKYGSITSDLLGEYQYKNVQTALAVVELIALRFQITAKTIREAMLSIRENTAFIGRFQLLSKSPLIIADSAHNVAGIQVLTKSIKALYSQKINCIIGMVNDKDIDEVLKCLPPDWNYYFTQASIPRALDAKVLSQKAAMHGLIGNSYSKPSMAKDVCLQEMGEDDLILIAGSIFLVADFLAL